MIDARQEFSDEFDRYVMKGKFRVNNFTEAVCMSDKAHGTMHGVEILTDWLCKAGFNKGISQDTELLEDLFLRLDIKIIEDMCGSLLYSSQERAREIYIDCLMHIEGVNENDNV